MIGISENAVLAFCAALRIDIVAGQDCGPPAQIGPPRYCKRFETGNAHVASALSVRIRRGNQREAARLEAFLHFHICISD